MGSDVTPGQLNLPAKDRFAWHVGLALFCLPLQIRWGQWAVMSPLGSDVTPGQLIPQVGNSGPLPSEREKKDLMDGAASIRRRPLLWPKFTKHNHSADYIAVGYNRPVYM